MGHNYVVKSGRSSVKSRVGKSWRVVKSCLGKLFDSTQRIDHLTNHVMEKSTSLVKLDDCVASTRHCVLPPGPKFPSQNPHHGDVEVTKGTLIPRSLQKLNSLHNGLSSPSAQAVPPFTLEANDYNDEEQEKGEVYTKRARSFDYSSMGEEEFKEMVESFIEGFNHRIAHEYYYTQKSDDS